MRIGNTYRILAKVENLKWCTVLEDLTKLSKTNRFIKPGFKDIKVIAPRLLDPCPFVGDFRLVNVGSPENILSILPSGDYMGKIRVKDTIQKADMIGESRFTIFH
jgi:hypothetical protein